jgi:glycine cleavage system H protein
MKAISEMKFPETLRYSDEHEWIKAGGDTFFVGISDYAQEQLGDIVFIELPDAGAEFSAGAEFGTVESVKAASELYMPIDCTVVKVNPALEDAPEIVNTSPYDEGWMLEIKPNDPAQIDTLLTSAQYVDMLKEKE